MSDVACSAIYYQRSKSVHEEFKLIELVTEREVLVDQLEAIIRDVKERRKECDDDTILETFTLFNNVRDVTIRLLKAIAAWQISFTKPIRPMLLQCDYMVDKILKHMDFINGSKIRKIFNFQFLRGNALLIPFPNLKNDTPIKVGQALGKEIKKFSSPPEADIIACYQVLINSLPDDLYQDKLVPLEKWLLSPWVPRIWISNSNKKFFTISKPTINHNTVQSTNVAEDTKQRTSKRHSILDSHHPPHTSTHTHTIAHAHGKDKDKDKETDGKHVRTTHSPALKRRNQLLGDHAADMLVLTDADATLRSKQQQAIPQELLSSEEQQEIQQLDFYYKELESMFLPKLGRRAVQTIVVGGNRLQPTRATTVQRSGSVLFSHTNKAAEESIQHAVTATNTNAFTRTEAALVAKRDRILADRNPVDVQYQRHAASASAAPMLKTKTVSNISAVDSEKDGAGGGAGAGEEGVVEGEGQDEQTLPGIVQRTTSRRNSDMVVSFQMHGDSSVAGRSTATPPYREKSPHSSAPPTPKASILSQSQLRSGKKVRALTEPEMGSPLSMSTSALREWFSSQPPVHN